FAEKEAIFDYHCHLSPRDIAENRQFKNLFEIWLEGDHYKWRAMRANGVAEKFCTGDADPFAKFQAWAATVPHTLRNPLYHWTHLELKRYFGIDELLDEESAARIWKKANAQLATPELTAQGILKKFNVTHLCTTDDPTDDLKHHHALACRLSDHGMNQCYAGFCSEKTAGAIFEKGRRGRPVSPEEHSQFASYMMLIFGRWDAEKGWTKQLHLGALRNNSTRLLRQA